ncbi:MAG: PPOX class F420-dependent oxidoreductase [Chloroflexi bacterium]|nr:PPOX class F420-dependent oxidoreductase [Chloroflexota bacterium]MCH8114616.1 PPOX class F420-dependent oxidoreductase [Chloroflexota bacterium]MCI0775835.1 PPOX class F420-dependent oxidoreductase [Chloroflexota bacterium]MCI0803308.1 PPOX class F420-dependent oxidoreductase [Chloroflexota bacterium]MCI0808300.1 PPOX class F420-dependent oxidoreductase [Chloroflexota bacterium]
MAKLTDRQIAFLKEPYIAEFVTLMKDGSPQITPVWIDTDGEHILVNSEEGRVKIRNVRRDPRVAVGIYDPENSYTRVLNVRGRVVEITTDGAAENIDDLSEKYNGVRPYPNHNPDQPRLLLKILPDRINSRI